MIALLKRKLHIGNWMIAMRNTGIFVQLYTMFLVLDMRVEEYGLNSLLTFKYISLGALWILWIVFYFKVIREKEIGSQSQANPYMRKVLKNQSEILRLLKYDKD